MNLYEEIVANVLKCNKCGLREKVINKYEDYKNSSDYCLFHFYYSHESALKSKFIIIMQNPGLLGKNFKKNKEYKDLSMIKKGDDFVSTMNGYLREWLRGKNKHFSKTFLDTLRDCGLITKYDNIDNYWEKYFNSEFIVTDLLKCRAETEDIKEENIKNVRNCTYIKN
jgi:hypothetical protein